MSRSSELRLHNRHVNSCFFTVESLGSLCSCSFSFCEQVHHRTGEAKRIATMILRAFRTEDCRILTSKSHARPHLEYCPIILTHICKIDRIAIEDVQRMFTRNLLGPSSSLNYGARYDLLGHDSLWLRPFDNHTFFSPDEGKCG